MARPGGLELPTFWFVARRSIQLSYGRAVNKYYHRLALGSQQQRRSAFCEQLVANTIRTNLTVKSRRITTRIRSAARVHHARNFGYAIRSHTRAGPPASESSLFRSQLWPIDIQSVHGANIELNLSARPTKFPTDRLGQALSRARSPRKAHSSARGLRPRRLALPLASRMQRRQSPRGRRQTPTGESSRATIPKPRSCPCGARPLARYAQR